MSNLPILLPEKIAKVFDFEKYPLGSVRYRLFRGGRSSGKSYSVAKVVGCLATFQNLRVLCAREFMNSISESFFTEIKAAITNEPLLENNWDIGANFLRSKRKTSEFIFSGLKRNLGSIKSKSGINICIIEEADGISEESFRILIPTIRAANSEIWIIWNPTDENAPVEKRFIKGYNPKTMIGTFINIDDNPFATDVSIDERDNDRKILSPEDFNHIWCGHYVKINAAKILADKLVIDDFAIDNNFIGPSYGLDFGFANDPLACIRFYEKENDNNLYIDEEVFGVGISLNHIKYRIEEKMPEISQYVIKADASSPDIIDYLQQNGFYNIVAAPKPKGSIKAGINFLRKYDKIIVRPQCKNFVSEMKLYSYKQDLSGNPLPEIIDKFNHGIDAVRYGLSARIFNETTPSIRCL